MMIQQPDGYTAAEVANLLERAKGEGKANISMSTFYRLVREGYIEKALTGERVKEARYNQKQVHDLIAYGTPTKRKQKIKRKEEQKEQDQTSTSTTEMETEGATDWVQSSDLAYVYVMDTELYGIENSVSPTTTLTWWRKNPYACRILFNKHNRKEVWGALSIIPMEEDTIYKLLSGELKEQDITSDQVLEYQSGHTYSCYVASVAIRSEHRPSFGQLLNSFLNLWCEQYPDIQVKSLYGFALNEEQGTGLRLIRKLYFAPRYDIGENAWELRLDRYNPSPVVQRFQECLQQSQRRLEQDIALPMREEDEGVTPQRRSVVADAKYFPATSQDIPALAPIDEAIFGRAPVAIEQYVAMHRSWYAQNHEVFHVLTSGEQVVGYVSTMPLPIEKIIKILREEAAPRDIRPEEIDQFQPGKPLNIYIAVMGVDSGFTQHQKRLLAGKLINGLTETFRLWAERGVDIQAIYARSRFEEGITILQHIGFQEMTDISPVHDKRIFCLNIETANGPFTEIYKKGIEAYYSVNSTQ